MKPHASGTFRIDKEAAMRKLTEERRKIWRHRLWLILEHFGIQLTFLGIIAMGALVGRCLAPGSGPVDRFSSTLLGAFLGCFTAIVFTAFWDIIGREKYLAIKKAWTPPNLAGKIDE